MNVNAIKSKDDSKLILVEQFFPLKWSRFLLQKCQESKEKNLLDNITTILETGR